MVDTIIVGSGPAGLEAAINLKIRKKEIILFGKKDLSKKLMLAPLINNYLGFPNIKGSDLKKQFINHLNHFDIEVTEENVTNIYQMPDHFIVNTNQSSYTARTVILATGANASKLFKNEEKLLGQGISYCATCDGLFYKNKVVALYGNNDESINDVKYLLTIAKKVYYISKNKVENAINIDKEIISINGENHITSISFVDEDINVDGFFIIRDDIRADFLVPGLKIENSHILVDRNMKTNLKGLFACGDITGKPYQYMKACGEGLVAAFSCLDYLNNKE